MLAVVNAVMQKQKKLYVIHMYTIFAFTPNFVLPLHSKQIKQHIINIVSFTTQQCNCV